MIGFAFGAECCGAWRVTYSDRTGAISRAWVVCEGCGHRRVVTVTWRAARKDEADRFGADIHRAVA